MSYEVLARLKTPGLLFTQRQKERCIEAMLNGLAAINLEYLSAYPQTPLLYQSGVRYRDDSYTKFDEWCDIPTTLARGWGDCDDLVPWRIAELWRDGVRNATGMAIAQKLSNGSILFHALIKFGNGQTEDPSRLLGMT